MSIQMNRILVVAIASFMIVVLGHLSLGRHVPCLPSSALNQMPCGEASLAARSDVWRGPYRAAHSPFPILRRRGMSSPNLLHKGLSRSDRHDIAEGRRSRIRASRVAVNRLPVRRRRKSAPSANLPLRAASLPDHGGRRRVLSRAADPASSPWWLNFSTSARLPSARPQPRRDSDDRHQGGDYRPRRRTWSTCDQVVHSQSFRMKLPSVRARWPSPGELHRLGLHPVQPVPARRSPASIAGPART